VTRADRVAAIAALAALLTWQAPAPAVAANPSFSCTGKLTPTEKVICANDSLAALDVALAAAYKAKLATLPAESANSLEVTQAGLIFTQKAWVAHRNTCGTNLTCIRQAYELRAAALAQAANAQEMPCSRTVGAQQAAVFVKQCIEVASETHPPCNAVNSCELIVSHNVTHCMFLGDGAPKFCAAYRNP